MPFRASWRELERRHQEFQNPLDTGLHRDDAKRIRDLLDELLRHHASKFRMTQAKYFETYMLTLFRRTDDRLLQSNYAGQRGDDSIRKVCVGRIVELYQLLVRPELKSEIGKKPESVST